MARLLCTCGNTLSNSLAPNDVTLHVYTDTEWDDIIKDDNIDPIRIPHPKYDVWRCPVCQRIMFFNWEYGKVVKQYVLEIDNEKLT